MPIAKHLRHFYQGPEWEATRRRILERAGNKCEFCRKPNHTHIFTATWPNLGLMAWSIGRRARIWYDRQGQPTVPPAPREIRRIFVVLTCAHLNHVPGDDRDDNLAAICQWCHLRLDRGHHRETRSRRKDRNRPLLGL